jgi:CIC family chloride channel protein
VFEELLRRFELRVAVATMSACSAGLVVMRLMIGDHFVFSVPPIVVSLFPSYLFFLVFGGIVGVLGVLYSRMIVAALDAADRLSVLRPEVQAALVGALVGLVGWISPDAIGSGEYQVQGVLDGGHTVALVATVFAVRLVLGPLRYAPGLPGGLFAPLLVIGAAAGLLLGKTMEALVPRSTPPLPAIAAVGMGALFVAVVRAPVTGIALVVEMTGATSFFMPLLTACATAVAVPTLLGSRPIYDTLQERDARRIAYRNSDTGD